MKKKDGLVCGVGVNDADHKTMRGKRVNGRVVVIWRCPYYAAWIGMIQRCYGREWSKKRKTYDGCTVCAEWLRFSNFKAWMEKQDWQGKHLDKDILIDNNREYSPDACAFVSGGTNNFLLKPVSFVKDLPAGVHRGHENGSFSSFCRNPFSKKVERLGTFCSVELAQAAWRKRKHEHAVELAKMQFDKRVADRLMTMFA